MTTFISLSYVVASTIKIKSEILGEQFATSREINLITSKLQEEFNKYDVDSIIINEIDGDYFSCENNLYIPKVSMSELEYKFKGYIPLEASIIIWNNINLIVSCILEIKNNQIEQLQNGISNTEDIPSLLNKVKKIQKNGNV